MTVGFQIMFWKLRRVCRLLTRTNSKMRSGSPLVTDPTVTIHNLISSKTHTQTRLVVLRPILLPPLCAFYFFPTGHVFRKARVCTFGLSLMWCTGAWKCFQRPRETQACRVARLRRWAAPKHRNMRTCVVGNTSLEIPDHTDCAVFISSYFLYLHHLLLHTAHFHHLNFLESVTDWNLNKGIKSTVYLFPLKLACDAEPPAHEIIFISLIIEAWIDSTTT